MSSCFGRVWPFQLWVSSRFPLCLPCRCKFEYVGMGMYLLVLGVHRTPQWLRQQAMVCLSVCACMPVCVLSSVCIYVRVRVCVRGPFLLFPCLVSFDLCMLVHGEGVCVLACLHAQPFVHPLMSGGVGPAAFMERPYPSSVYLLVQVHTMPPVCGVRTGSWLGANHTFPINLGPCRSHPPLTPFPLSLRP